MIALGSVSQGLNSTLVIVVLAAIIAAACWRFLIKVGIALLLIGFFFVVVSFLLGIVHGLHALIR
jgi:hypothetical protein